MMGLNQPKRILTGIFLVSVNLILIWGGQAGAAEKVTVFVSIAPQKFFLQQIGRQRVDVQVMVQAGASPATYEPRPRQMAAISKAQAYFAIGVSFERTWLGKISAANPAMQVVHTDHGIPKIPMTTHPIDSERHRQKDHQDHHGELDPHIWLSPTLVMAQARTILKALDEIDPNHSAEYETGARDFISKLAALDAELKKTFAGKQGLQFMVFHPSWGYFARSYGLKQVPVEIEGKDPKPAQLKGLIEHAKKKDIKIIFVQPQFSTRSAGLIAKEIGGQVVFADPLAPNWLGNLREVAKKFKAALR